MRKGHLKILEYARACKLPEDMLEYIENSTKTVKELESITQVFIEIQARKHPIFRLW